MKKLLANRLRERQDTIEFRKIRSRLMVQANNDISHYLTINLSPKTIMQLQNDGLMVERINDGTEKFKISW